MSSENDECIEETANDADSDVLVNSDECIENGESINSVCQNKREETAIVDDADVKASVENSAPENCPQICVQGSNSCDKPKGDLPVSTCEPLPHTNSQEPVEVEDAALTNDSLFSNLPESKTDSSFTKTVQESNENDSLSVNNSEHLASTKSGETLCNVVEAQIEDMHLINHEQNENLPKVPNGIPEDLIAKLFPIHGKLQTELLGLQRVCKQQSDQISRLQNENHKLTRELTEKTSISSSEIYEVQMEALEKTIMQLQREAEMHKNKLINHDEVAKRTIAQLQQDLGSKLEKMTKMYEAANKDKETMVIKYAQAQKEVLNLKKILEDLDKKIKDGMKEKESLLLKIKNLNAERSRIAQCFETKNSELNVLQRENEKLKDQITSKDIKIKWAQNKLRTEMDAHKETEVKLERTQQKLQEMREEAEQIRHDCQAMIRTYQDSEEIKSNSLDLQLKEKESELKIHKQEKNDQDEVYHLVKRELDALKKKHKLTTEENNALTIKVQALERERLEYESNCSRLKEMVNNYKQEIVDLSGKLSEMENLHTLLERQKEKNTISLQEIERLRQANLEIQNDMDSCREREGELLEFTERLTSKNVVLQSEFAALEAKNQMMALDLNRLSKMNENLDEENANLQSKFQEENVLRQQETQLLARKLAEKTRTVENLMLKLDEEMNENRVMKRRHVASVKVTNIIII